jgi:hypothetical protein
LCGSAVTSKRRRLPPESAEVTTKVSVSPVAGLWMTWPARATGGQYRPSATRVV